MRSRFEVLGPVRVILDGQAQPVVAAKPLLLLTSLLLEPNRPVSRERLISALWEDRPPKSALANMRSYANRLRHVLGGERLHTQHPGYRLEVGPGELDLTEFRARFAEGREAVARADHGAALRHYTRALDLWQGHAAENVPHTLGVRVQLEALEDQRVRAVEECARARLALGRFGEVIDGVRDTLVLRPTRERLWGHLMVALYRTGDVAGALSVYAEARRALDDHLGVGPGPELTEMHRLMLRRDPCLDSAITWRPVPRPCAQESRRLRRG